MSDLKRASLLHLQHSHVLLLLVALLCFVDVAVVVVGHVALHVLVDVGDGLDEAMREIAHGGERGDANAERAVNLQRVATRRVQRRDERVVRPVKRTLIVLLLLLLLTPADFCCCFVVVSDEAEAGALAISEQSLKSACR